MKDKECEGCFTTSQCEEQTLDVKANCPCKICLLKVVCNRACEEYGKFWIADNIIEVTQYKFKNGELTPVKDAKL
jgi:hypothetical protein